MEDIISVVAPHLGEPVGNSSEGNYKFRCPFHKGGHETRPAFYLHAETGLAFCHACNRGWNLPQLLKDLRAPLRLVTMAATLLGEKKKQKRFRRRLEHLATINPLPEELLGVFHHCPQALLDAGFTQETLLTHDVGYDVRNDRITFPLRDHLGRLIGVSGRGDFGYHFYGEKDLRPLVPDFRPSSFKKSQFVWNLQKIYPLMFHSALVEPVVICEGFKAAMWCAQHGHFAVAIMGSYLSNAQRRLLERLGVPLILFLDNDDAGGRGTFKATEMLKGSSDLRIAVYPDDARQPDDLTEEELTRALTEAQPFYRRF